MARRVPLHFVAFLLLLFSSGAAAQEPAGSILVRYSFDDAVTDTGPDTFRVFEHSRGTVGLSHVYRWSGDSSVEIRDVAGDADFPELQGYFPSTASGTLFAHFAFLTTTAEEEFNVALAGPTGFRLARDGIGFWLQARERFLFHHSDSIPRRLFVLEPFTWYFVDVTYRVDEGTYDLVIRREGDSGPRVALSRQPNAANQPGSIVDKFSFVGDVEEDSSSVVYYVDDVVVGTDRKVQLLPFAATGPAEALRRELHGSRHSAPRQAFLPSLIGPGGSRSDGLGAARAERIGPGGFARGSLRWPTSALGDSKPKGSPDARGTCSRPRANGATVVPPSG